MLEVEDLNKFSTTCFTSINLQNLFFLKLKKVFCKVKKIKCRDFLDIG